MKKLLYLLLLTPIIYLTSCSKSNVTPTITTTTTTTTTTTPHTYINHPDSTLTIILDANFEQELINLGYDNNLNGSVYTSNINNVTSVVLQYLDIADLTGIENFTALTTLYCNNNGLTSLYLSRNTALTTLFCYNNQLTNLDVSANTALVELGCAANPLTSLDVSSNTALTQLHCSDNQLTSLDVSTNTALTWLNCRDNQLTSLDIRNGNNTNMGPPTNPAYYLDFTNNPNLYCINIDDFQYSYNNWFNIDAQSYFSEDCSGK